MVFAAVHLSWTHGWRGKISLHSLPDAEIFYRDKIGMTMVGPDAEHEDLTYFELTQSQAVTFFRNGLK